MEAVFLLNFSPKLEVSNAEGTCRLGRHFPVRRHSHVLPPVPVPEPVKVNPLGQAGGEEESVFQKELSEGSQGFLNVGKKEVNYLLRKLWLCFVFFRSKERTKHV